MGSHTETPTKVWLAALAGLLHDIGKFALRAGERGTREWDDLGRKDYGYYHALLTADFVEQYVPDPWRVAVKHLAGNHHRPQSRDERIIALADHLSAGERADPTEDTRAAHPGQLLSVFCGIQADKKQAPEPRYVPLQPLRLAQEALFPGSELPRDQIWKRYEDMWGDFTGEAGRLRQAHAQEGDLPTYVETMLLLMQRYTWCLPSAYYHTRPDISLYDHSRMTAALAAVLMDSALDDERLERLDQTAQEAEEELALLVGGDISGVQNFIYTITARGATSALRGRSFYLQLLTEAVARYLLRRLDLPPTNLIYAGGGNFTLIARPGDRARLRDIRRDVSRILLAHHRGDLYLAIAALPLQGRDFYWGRIRHKWEALGDQLQRAKQRRFAELDSDLEALFRAQGHGGNEEQQCQVCGREHRETKPDPKSITEENPEGVRKCPACLSYEGLGEKLRRAQYLLLEQVGPPAPAGPEMVGAQGLAPPPGGWEEVLRALGLSARLAEDRHDIPAGNEARRTILALSDAALADLSPQPRTAVGRRLLVNVTPILREDEIKKLKEKKMQDLPDAGSTKPFHVLEAQAQGIPRLGVLRMDVDNLGQLFAEGLGEHATLSRLATLSFAVSLYFEGWVEHLAARRNDQDRAAGLGERLYSIYAGGDDLFFVGSWDAVAELAREVRADLSRYAAGHPGIHASAGIALVGGKYPLYQAAEDARRAEEAAKGLQWWDNGERRSKDAIAFLGQALPWKQFGLEDCAEKGLHNAHALMHLLVDMIEAKGEAWDKTPPRALLRRLIGLHREYLERAEARRREGKDHNRAGQPQTLWGRWMWLGFYSLSRMYDQSKLNSIRELRDQLKAEEFRSMAWVGLAARWAELRLRQREQR